MTALVPVVGAGHRGAAPARCASGCTTGPTRRSPAPPSSRRRPASRRCCAGCWRGGGGGAAPGHRRHRLGRPGGGADGVGALPGLRHPGGLARAAGQPAGAWLAPILALLERLAPAVPSGTAVLVLTDRGLWSPRSWDAIRGHGWHPLMRIRREATFRPTGGDRGRATALVPAPGTPGSGPAPPSRTPPSARTRR